MESKVTLESVSKMDTFKRHHENRAFEYDEDGLPVEKKNGAPIPPPDYGSIEPSGFNKVIEVTQSGISNFFDKNSRVIWIIIGVIAFALYCWYLVEAMLYEFGTEPAYRLLIGTILVLIFMVSLAIMSKFPAKSCNPRLRHWKRISAWTHRSVAGGLIIFAIAYIIAEIGFKTPRNLISLGGMAVLVLFTFVCSHNPARVNWQPVFWGIMLQFIFALIILRWGIGYEIFQWLGDRVLEFLQYSDEGAIFVFGDKFTDHFFAMKVLPVIVFFSTAVSILYYLGAMQFIIRNIAKGLATVLGTSPAESLNAAGNIFLGQTEAPLMIRPFFEKLTVSEIHAVCTGGFATIAGSVMAAYIIYGVPANHLLSASVMSAPAALAMAKLFWPETEETRATSEDVYQMEKGTERNVIEAASQGASNSIKLVANVAVNLIAFVSLLGFVNATLKWFGERAGMKPPGHEYLTFQYICSYVFYPLAYLMGVETVDCGRVAELIGIKTFINEFVAYTALSKYISNRNNLTWYEGMNFTDYNATWHYQDKDIVYDHMNITLDKGILQDRSVVISTYALCGFSNISSIGIQLGALGAMAPSRRSDLSKVIIRAMIAGNIACFMTACISGLLYEGEL
ncbi:solute carrier family 28 member 3-like [Mytilus galloprovincialis]|uniref:solute carrier family 28 member 3-like n=1 Tax=Mytilus edulis TaxID=6550 RepID=UPI0039EFA2A4